MHDQRGTEEARAKKGRSKCLEGNQVCGTGEWRGAAKQMDLPLAACRLPLAPKQRSDTSG